jgi:hypothetical protein
LGLSDELRWFVDLGTHRINIPEIPPFRAAIIAGYGLLFMTVIAFACFPILENLFVPEDASKTLNNITANELKFRIAILGFLTIVVLDVVVAWALYILLKPVNISISLITAWFRVVYAAAFAVALNDLFTVLHLSNRADNFKVLETGHLEAQVILFFNAFNQGWDIGLTIFSLHLLFLGYLVFKSGYIPKIMGIMLIVTKTKIDNDMKL